MCMIVNYDIFVINDGVAGFLNLVCIQPKSQVLSVLITIQVGKNVK